MINLKKKQHSIQVALIVKIVLMCEYLFFRKLYERLQNFHFFLGKDIKSESNAFYIFIPDQIDFF